MDNFKVFDSRIQTPCSILVTGQSQSGKTHFCLKLLENAERMMNPCPRHVFYFYGVETSATTKLKNKENITLVQGLPENGFDDYLLSNTLFIIDDLLLESVENKHVTNLFTRESHHRNVTIVLILQDLFSYGKQRKTFLRNSHYLCLFNNYLDKSSVYTIGQRIMPKRIRLFLSIFEKATQTPYSYLFIDGRANTPESARFRSNIFGPYQTVYVVNDKK